jgi:hypothetical protein
MTLSKIYIIRHAEKPPAGPSIHLTERGVTRAAALSVMFDHARNGAYLPLDALYATAPSAHSRRAIETLEPLHAALPALPFNTSFENGDERGLVAAMKASPYGVVLVAWHHEHIHTIVEALGVQSAPRWDDDDVFDRVLTIDLGATVASITDTPQRLLFGDSTA